MTSDPQGVAGALRPVPEDLWGEPALAYHVQPGFAPGVDQRLGDLQRQAAAAWPEPLLLAPPQSLHVTVYSLVPVRGRFDKDAYWAAIAERSEALLRACCAGAAPFALRFFQLRATDAAVIALAEDPGGLIGRIRAALADGLEPPPGHAPMRYDIVHSSIARHSRARAVPASALARLEGLTVDFSAPVDRMKIMREIAYPCLVMEEVASVPLR